MERFVISVGHIVCRDQGRDIVYFMTKTHMTGNRYVHCKLLQSFRPWMYML